jgi:DNA/RNA-binding domain of Phe-tRNA-synthetase-like protein
MREHTCSIHKSVFEQFPGYVRGVVIIEGVKNGPSSPALLEKLRAEEAVVRTSLDIGGLAAHACIASWREAYRSFGAKPSKFRPSMEALIRRVLRGEELRSISALVDIGTVISLRHLVPSGGHAIDVVNGDIELRPAHGGEIFVPFGSDQTENPEAGEIIFAEGDVVLTRRWTWRQARHTLLQMSTCAVEFNVDGLPPVSINEAKAACNEIGELVQEFCGGTVRKEMLTQASPSIQL